MKLAPIPSPRGFTIIPVHYTHDPSKATDEWAFDTRKGYASQADWDSEMEIDFTSRLGKLAYTSFDRQVHLSTVEIPVRPELPLHLEVDFNVDPMVWEVSQTYSINGVSKDYYIDEIVLAPASIEQCANEFLNLFQGHRAELYIYGDATGHGRDAQTARSDYDLLKIALRHWPTGIQWKVPRDNPPEKDRVNAVNRRLIGADGQPHIVISPKCPELVLDFEEVAWREDGKKLLKVYATADPYHRRTHGSDGAGYRIWREHPTTEEAMKIEERKHVPPPVRKYGSIPGMLEGGRPRR